MVILDLAIMVLIPPLVFEEVIRDLVAAVVAAVPIGA